MDAETDQYAPELVLDNSHIDPPGTFETGYHLTADLVDHSIRFLAGHIAERARRAVADLARARRQPCAAPGAARLILSYDDVVRRRLGRRARAPSCPPDRVGDRASRHALPPRNDGVKPWDEHSADERRFFTRLQAAFAGMLDHADQQLARLVAFLERPASATTR